MTKAIAWKVGGGSITLDYTGEGSGAVTVTSDINEGIDREQTVTISNAYGQSAVVTVTQEGLREPLLCSDGAFLCADGGTFNVLKQ